MPVKSYRVSCMLMIQQFILFKKTFLKFNRSTSINIELEKFSIWFKLNKLTLNVEKTKYMIFRKRRKIDFL